MDFSIWFSTGLQHIADWQGYDHILYLLVLCGTFQFSQWKKVLVLITAFTVGHSVTLALSVTNLLEIKTKYIEFLIPITILTTCVYTLLNLKKWDKASFKPNYFLTLFFGFIHGMGFSYLLKSLLGTEENIIFPLLAFNLGLEVGQILILITVFVLIFITQKLIRYTNYNKNFFIASSVFGIAFIMTLQRFQTLIAE
ncbi:MAG: HupE/UreJ family protein [Bacteroidota bacterium]